MKLKGKPKYSELFMVFVLTLLAIITLLAIFNVVTEEPEETPLCLCSSCVCVLFFYFLMLSKCLRNITIRLLEFVFSDF